MAVKGKISRKLIPAIIILLMAVVGFALVIGVGDKKSPGQERAELERQRKAEQVAAQQPVSVEEERKRLEERESKERKRLEEIAKLEEAAKAAAGTKLPPPQLDPALLAQADAYEKAKIEAAKRPGLTSESKAGMVAFEGFAKSEGIAQVIPRIPPAEGAQPEAAQSQPAAQQAPAQQPQQRAGSPDRNEEWKNRKTEAQQKAVAKRLTPEVPASRYMLMQGTIVNGVMQTALNSRLPGQIVVRVTQDVYDSLRGQTLLLPKGSRLIGEWNTDVAEGQSRVMVAMTRLIYPSGASVNLGAMDAGDSLGRSGIEGKVNNHWFRRFGASILLAILASAATPESTTVINTGTGGADLNASAASAVGDVLKEHLERVREIRPEIDVAHGKKIALILQKDLELAPAVTRPLGDY